MKDYFYKKGQIRAEQEKYYKEKINRRLKYAAFTAIGISLFLILSMIVLFDRLSCLAIHLMRGFAGLFAIIFIILTSILLYRVNDAHLKDKWK